MEPAAAGAPRGDKAGAFEDAEVLGHAEPAHRKAGRELADALPVALGQAIEEQPAVPVGKGLEDEVGFHTAGNYRRLNSLLLHNPQMAAFTGRVRYFRPELRSGLAVIDIPAAVASELGGLKQMRVKGSINGAQFASNTMPAGNRVLALSLSKALLRSAGLAVGAKATVEIERA